MDKTLVVLMTATIIIITGLVMITMSGQSLGSFSDQNKDSQSNNYCSFQCKNAKSLDEIDDGCECSQGKKEELLKDSVREEVT